MYITRPDGTTPLFGDDDGGRLAMLDVRAANDFRGTLATGAALFNRGDYKFVAGDAAEELLWLTGVEGLSTFDSIRRDRAARKLRCRFTTAATSLCVTAGHADSNYLLFDCGPHGRSTVVTLTPMRWRLTLLRMAARCLSIPAPTLTRARKSCATGFAARMRITLSRSTVNRLPFPADAFSWKTKANCTLRNWISDERFDFVSGNTTASCACRSRPIRGAAFSSSETDYWIVRDSISPAGKHDAKVSFHFDSSLTPVLNGQVRETQSGFAIQCFGDGQWVEEDRWVSHCYGQKEPSKATSSRDESERQLRWSVFYCRERRKATGK